MIWSALEFFYESLETLREVKWPSKDEIIKMTLAVLFIVFIAAIILALADWIFLNIYNTFFYTFFTKLFS